MLKLPATDSHGQLKISLQDQHCITPDCSCNTAWLAPYMTEGEHSQAMSKQIGATSLGVDLSSGAIDASDAQTAMGVRMQHALAMRVNEKMLQKLRLRHAQARKWGEDKFWRFKDWNQLEPGGCVFWSELFPTVPDFHTKLGEETLLLFDQYCWLPSCDCQKAILSLFKVKAGSTKAEPVADVVFNLTNAAHYVHQRHGGTTDEEASETLDAILAHLPEVPSEIRRRSDFLKTEFASHVVEAGYVSSAKIKKATCPIPAPRQSTNLISSKVGRNDPCPCGSGKKSKKCCLR